MSSSTNPFAKIKSPFLPKSYNQISNSPRVKKDAYETRIIMDESYISKPDTVMLIHNGDPMIMNAYASRRFHDLDHKPFVPSRVVEHDSEDDDDDNPANVARNNHNIARPRPTYYRPTRSYAVDGGWRSEPNIAVKQNVVREDRFQTDKSNKYGDSQRKRSQSMSIKDKVYHTWVATKFRVHIRGIRIERWFKECLGSTDRDSASIHSLY